MLIKKTFPVLTVYHIVYLLYEGMDVLHCEDWIVSCFPIQAMVDPPLEPGWLLGSRQSPYSGCLVIGFNGVIN